MIKINLELPEFDKELSISVTLRKDGEVITTSSSSPGVVTEVSGGELTPVLPETERKTTTKSKRGDNKSNLMDMSF